MPLSPKAINIVKSTVPLLETGGEILIKHFYQILLTDYPDVVPFFNKSHQTTGDQPRALARAVLAYAKNIDNLGALGPVAGPIIHKHVSLNVKPEHYPIVGQVLLRSLVEVLGKETATPEVIEAWGSAYQQLADILIAAEEGVYKANEEKPGGWRNEREFVLARKEKESSEITSFYWKSKDGKPIVAYTPGQFIALQTRINGELVRRNYSLSALPNSSEYRISVKLHPHGVVSTYLHNLAVGSNMQFFPPAGDFVLKESTRPLVLIAGGVGITPLISMAEKTLAEGKRDVTLIHSSRNQEVHGFKGYFESLASRYPGRLTIINHYSNPDSATTKLFTREDLARALPPSPDVYFVGPEPFMKNIKQYLTELGVPASQYAYEFFGPGKDL
jgi:nitric oxide dioxygenase